MTNDQIMLRPRTAADVVAGVLRARETRGPVTVVSGAHSTFSHGDSPGVRIELADMAGIEVSGTRVRIGAGATWGDVASTLAREGLALSSGDTSSVGVGGLTLGGGIGWMVRAWGLAADQLVGAQLVTATGDVCEVSAAEHPELLWALRGGGGNFGVVTRLDFEAHRLPGIAFAQAVVGEDQSQALRSLREVMRDAPDEVTATYMDVPPMDPSAPPGASITAVWAGDEAERLRAVLEPLSRASGLTIEISAPAYRDILLEMPMPEGEEVTQSPAFIGANGLFAELDDALIDHLVAFRAAHPASVVFARSLGGAFSRVPQDSTAFPARTATWFVMAAGFDIPGVTDEAERTALRAAATEIERHRIAEYSNFSDVEDATAVAGMYDPAALVRLKALKAEWDPENLFRRNHNIIP